MLFRSAAGAAGPPSAPAEAAAAEVAATSGERSGPSIFDPNFKDVFLADIRKGKMVFYSTVVAQAQRIDVSANGITFTFTEKQRALRDVFEQNRAWLETLVQTLTGRRVPVASAFGEAPPPPPRPKIMAFGPFSASTRSKLYRSRKYCTSSRMPLTKKSAEELLPRMIT